MDIAKVIASELGIKVSQVEATVKLIDEGSTIPFIARYRKTSNFLNIFYVLNYNTFIVPFFVL